ncbi:hypothetical protein [Mycobacterium sp. NPDC050853]|uniref:hypothetical protein n=1 Tax=Mycobacterium sp. NPDC050853 TaxID=3155160 RepID=UPI0033CD20DD
MAPVLAVSPENVRAGAAKIAGAKSVVAGISSPDASGATAGLSGLATATALAGVQQAVTDSLGVIGGRYDKMAQLIEGAVFAFMLVSATLEPSTRAQTLTGIVGKSFTSMGDLNSATPA